ncbi:RagB/SusD family nutrient uptake outer membrane protein [Litoribacter ruber]|uniref:RagB/SusD family nutrient uptake outer membrane protein n=1 Tax=Litoribacter ruber TaxID=702568 RepID=UPI001BDAE202|nr:RagB/SusD family nutrient uptake outer membrane protein [Litoribacter ruber]MBT0812413.1 RagB/SusD family nutrient uptake outer membrane protein [Litoribacter ruber]
MKKSIYKNIGAVVLAVFTVTAIPTSCTGLLDEPLENAIIADETDYSQSSNMIQMLYGAYGELYRSQWETHTLIGVRGDDVTAAGDQVPLTETDLFRYDRNFWMYNSVWLNLYSDLIYWHGAMEEIRLYQEAGANAANAEQYIAEIKVMQGLELIQLAKLWGSILIPTSSQPAELYNVEVSTFEEVMQYVSALMDEALPALPNVHPSERSDVRGGITRGAALAVKAMANLELNNWAAVTEATGEIISSGNYALEADYYQLFKVPGKLNRENVLEFQYSDFGTSTGTLTQYPFETYGPASWTPAVAGASNGWGFYAPTAKYVRFMLDRGEQTRLVTTVLFTPDGIAEVQSEPGYENLPDWVSNITPDGDQFNNHPRYNFLSGKHYLPSTQLTEGRFGYGTNNNFTVIRYAEILLMHAEAVVNGGAAGPLSADEAVNTVRARAGLEPLAGVALEDVLNEKYAEFGMELGIRFYDLMRYGIENELSFGGRNFNIANHRFLPYPLEQTTILPQIGTN